MAGNTGDDTAVIIMALERLAESHSQTQEELKEYRKEHREEMKSMRKDVNNVSLLLEKFSNIEKTQSDSQRRTHHRIDAQDRRIDGVCNGQNGEGCPPLREAIVKCEAIASKSQEDRNELKSETKKLRTDVTALQEVVLTPSELKAIRDDIRAMQDKPVEVFWAMVKGGFVALVVAGVTYLGVRGP